MKNSVLVFGIALASPSFAIDASHDNIETTLVRAARDPIPISTIGSAASIVNRQTLEQRQVAPLSEILRSVPGVAVNRVGVTGSQTQIRLRGSEANQVLVFIDGVRANDPAQGDEFNMAHVLSYDIESVEVIRGPQSALWGSDALGGVISITTRGTSSGTQANAFIEGGSNSWQNVGASGAYVDGQWRASASVNSLETDGENISREGSEEDGYENLTTTVALGYDFTEDFTLDTNFRYTDGQNDFDGTDFSTGLPADSANQTDAEQLYGRIIARLNTMDNRWLHQLSYSITQSNNKNRSENDFAPTGFDITESDADISLAYYQSTFKLVEGHSITGALEKQETDFRQRGPIGFGDPNRDESMDTNSAVLEYRAALTETVSLQGGARYDDNSDFKDKTTGRVSAAWRILEGDTKLRASYGSGIKNPTFSERYGYFNDFIGNPDLKPEESIGWDVGIDQQLLSDQLSFSLTWFQEELEDEINGFVFDPASGGYTAQNKEGKSKRKGLEFNSTWLILPSLTASIAYTWLDSTEEDDFGQESDEIRRPEHIASANVNWGFLADRGNLNLNVDYNGEQDDFFFPPVPPYQERVTLDAFTLVTVATSYQVTPKLQVFARVENALDEDYEEVLGFVALGRTAYAGLRYNFAD